MIEVKNLNYIYNRGMPEECQALYDINLTVPDGTIAALIGHTGSGKSTLAQLFCGLLEPTLGEVFLDGEDIKKISRRDICRKVGFVFQYPEHQLFEETVYKDIAFGPKNLGLDGEEIKQRVLWASSKVGLEESCLEKAPFELSGGQQRRAAIAGVLAMKPRILILDEPTAGLDPKGRNSMLDMIKNMRGERSDMTIIFVSHSMEDVAKTAERVIVMNKGRIDMDSSVSEVFSKETRLAEIGLNVPQITQIAEKLRRLGYDIPKDIYTAETAAAAIKRLLTGERNV